MFHTFFAHNTLQQYDSLATIKRTSKGLNVFDDVFMDNIQSFIIAFAIWMY